MLYHKLCIISLIILLLCLYFYVIKDNFENFGNNDTPNTTSSTPAITVSDTISFQLTNEIAKVLEISPARIYGLKYDGDINYNILTIDFDIMDNTVNYRTEKTQGQAETQAINLVNNDTFFVTINNKAVKLRKMSTIRKDSALFDDSIYFNNEGLKEIGQYTTNKYISAPNDDSLTKFYTLAFDKNNKLTPIMK